MTRTAAPGERVSVGPGYVWRAYGKDTAALYLTSRGLVRRDERGWWHLGQGGQRVDLHPVELLFVVGTAPGGWCVLAEQEQLLDGRALALEVLGTANARA